MLREIKELLKERKSLNLKELAIHFQISESAMEAMLQILLHKNMVKKIELDCGACFGACSSCSFKVQQAVYTLTESKTDNSINKEETS